MTLGDRQRQFPPMVALLLQWVVTNGLQCTFGECYRTPEQAALNAQHGSGITNSLHCERLAVDLNLFRDGVYLTDSAEYEAAGVYWESLGGSWGGRFSKPDGNHFSLEWQGVR